MGLSWRIEYWVRYYQGGLRERVGRWIAWHLPRDLAMWTYVRVAAHATTGKHGNTVVPELTVMDALKRWDDKGE